MEGPLDNSRIGRGPWRVKHELLTSRGKSRNKGWNVWQPMDGDPSGKHYTCVAARGLATRGEALAVAAALNALEERRGRS
jgi:hypothetical protein